MKSLSCILVLVAAQSLSAQWIKQNVDTTASLRGLSVVNEKVVWASGTGGTVIRTIDGGKTWKVMTVPGSEKLDFRDVEAFDANTAYVLSIGNGESSRIYKTTDGGTTWTEQFRNKNEKAFFDAIACWDRKHCIGMGDPVDGKFELISTSDGTTWKSIVGNRRPSAKDGEAAFAASGTCLISNGKSTVFLVTGGTDARVWRSDDRGQTWRAASTSIVKGTAASGIFAIAMRDAESGVIVGGNYEKPNDATNVLAITIDGGRSWRGATGLSGYRSGVAYLSRNHIVTVGTSGSDVSNDGGKTWRPVGILGMTTEYSELPPNLNAVQAKGEFAWGVGPGGLVAKYSDLTDDKPVILK